MLYMIDYKNIKVAIFDVDGVLTNGIYQISEDGRITKSFYTRDFYGIEQLLKKGIIVIIITQSHDNVIQEQIKRICSHSDLWNNSVYKSSKLRIFTQVEDKKERIEEYLKSFNLKWENIAYMGDAENDIECLELAGIAAAPFDCIEEIEDVDFMSNSNGGEGAVYEFCKWLLEKKEKNKKF